jgi:hypothetical protein
VTDVITDKRDVKTPDVGVVELDELDQQLVGQLVDRARSQGLRLTGEDGLLAQLTKTIIESAAEGEMDDHLGSAKHDPARRDGLKCVYLAVMSIDPTGKGRKRWVSPWKARLNAFELAFPGRLITSRN